MTSTLITTMTKCEFGDWIGIAVIAGIGLFSLIVLALGGAVLAK